MNNFISISGQLADDKLVQQYVKSIKEKTCLNPKQFKWIGEIVKNSLINETKNRNWINIPDNISLIENIPGQELTIYIKSKKWNTIAGYQHFGTVKHFIKPVKKRALSWVSGGTRYFSKGHYVKGIKPTKFFSISDVTKNKVDEYLKNLLTA